MPMITEDKLLRLKSGTDVRGVSVKTENEEIELTDEVVSRICVSFVRWLIKKKHKENIRIAVGHDSRISAERIKNAAISAFVKEGAEVYDCSLSSTPAMFMSVVLDIKVDASLEITASHHPFERNGLKFLPSAAGLKAMSFPKSLKWLLTANRQIKTEAWLNMILCVFTVPISEN